MVEACLGRGGRGPDAVWGAKAWAICSPQGSASASVTWEVGAIEPTSGVLPSGSCFVSNPNDGQEEQTQQSQCGGVSQHRVGEA